MKILYAFQGTGNGHQTRAKEFIPLFRKYAQVDVLVSGGEPDKVFDFPVDYRFKGVGFRFGNSGGIDLVQSFRDLDSMGFLREIKQAPVHGYDLVINDFEPVTAWACRRTQIPVVGMSHQAAVVHSQSPKPLRIASISRHHSKSLPDTSTWASLSSQTAYSLFLNRPQVSRQGPLAP